MTSRDEDVRPFGKDYIDDFHEPTSEAVYDYPQPVTGAVSDDLQTSTPQQKPPQAEQGAGRTDIVCPGKPPQPKEVCDDKEGNNSAVFMKEQSTNYPGPILPEEGEISGRL